MLLVDTADGVVVLVSHGRSSSRGSVRTVLSSRTFSGSAFFSGNRSDGCTTGLLADRDGVTRLAFAGVGQGAGLAANAITIPEKTATGIIFASVADTSTS